MGRVSRTAASTGKRLNWCITVWPIRSRTGEKHGAKKSANAWPEPEHNRLQLSPSPFEARREYRRVMVGRFAPNRSRSTTAADALDLLVERRVFLVYRIVRVAQI